jgi:AcrR family transcriptional regulator
VSSPLPARERLVETAYDLMTRYGVRAVGVDRIAAEAGLTKTTLYRQFRSKDELVLATLELREELWTEQWLRGELERRGGTAERRLLGIFDLFDEWFNGDPYEGCFFVNSVLEFHEGGPIHATASAKLTNVRKVVQDLAEQAEIRDPARFAHQWHLLMLGAIVAATEGHLSIARLAREAGAALLEHERTSNAG